MATFTRTHMNTLADMVRGHVQVHGFYETPDTTYAWTASIVRMLVASNPRFDQVRFVEACGLDRAGWDAWCERVGFAPTHGIFG